MKKALGLIFALGVFFGCTSSNDGIIPENKEEAPSVGALSVSVDVNGTSHTIPETGEEGWGTNVTAWIQAISANTIHPDGGTFTLTDDIDFGSSYGVGAGHFAEGVASPASAGVLRLARPSEISWRNQANSADVSLGVDSSDNLEFEGVDVILSTGLQTLASKTITGAAISGSSYTGINQYLDNAGVELRELSANGGSYTKLKASAALAGSIDFILPDSEGSAGEYLQTDGAGQTSWAAVSVTNAVATKTTTYTITTSDLLILANAASGAFTLTLPTAVGNSGKEFEIKKIDSTQSNLVTLDGDGSETIDGASSITLSRENSSVIVRSDNANWRVVARNLPGEYKEATGAIGNYTITAGNFGDLGSISLDAGEWDVSAQIVYYSNGATSATSCYIGISSTSGNSSTGLGEGDNLMYITKRNTSTIYDPIYLAPKRMAPSATTTYYLKARVNGSITNMQAGYKIFARRISN